MFYARGFSEPVYKYIQGQTVEGLRKSARPAHILSFNWQPIRSAFCGRNRDRPQHRDHYPTLCDKCVGSFKSLKRRIERLDLRFNVLIRKTRRPNHLQILEQGSTFSSIILRPWVLVRPGIEPEPQIDVDYLRSLEQIAFEPGKHWFKKPYSCQFLCLLRACAGRHIAIPKSC